MNKIWLPRSEESIQNFEVNADIAIALLNLIDPSVEIFHNELTQRDFNRELESIYDPQSELTMAEFDDKYRAVLNKEYPLQNFVEEVSKRSMLRVGLQASSLSREKMYAKSSAYDLVQNVHKELVEATLRSIASHAPKNTSPKSPYMTITRMVSEQMENQFLRGGIRKNAKVEIETPDLTINEEQISQLYLRITDSNPDELSSALQAIRTTLMAKPEEYRYEHFKVVIDHEIQQMTWKEVAIKYGYASGEAARTIGSRIKDQARKLFD